MICELNDLAYIKKAIRPANVGLVVTCKTYLGYYLMDDIVEINGERWYAIVSDNYWLVENEHGSIETQFGLSKQSYVPDLWLTPIKTDGVLDDTEIKNEDTIDA